MLSGGEIDDSFPSMMMAYYTDKARKKQARKQRAPDAQSKGILFRIFAVLRRKRKPPH